MSLSLVLSNAITGLQASTKQADLIANNVANALTDGYGRRELALESGVYGGVKIVSVERASAPFAQEARLLAQAEAGSANTFADAASRLAEEVGEPGEVRALSTDLSALEDALAAAADTPESATLLTAAAQSASDYVQSINRIAIEAMSLRSEADASIATQVSTINSALSRIDSINSEIKARTVAGGDTAALQDQRDRLIEQISSIIPVKVYKREFGEVAIYAKNGGQLLDGKVFELEFTRTPVVTPNMTLANGALSGITQNGVDIAIGSPAGGGLFDGGSLAAAFELRDTRLPEFADDLDALAEDLILRTQGLAADPTLTPTDAGLFTDDGAAYNPADRLGLALRVSVNANVDPAQGGDPALLRDGILAVAPGDSGESSVLRGLQDALSAVVAAPAGSNLTASRSAAGFASELSSFALTDAAREEEKAAFQTGRAITLSDTETALTGVDTDQELSRLLIVEQTYAANARVISVVDELLERLLAI